jgi:hypothetical protein
MSGAWSDDRMHAYQAPGRVQLPVSQKKKKGKYIKINKM